MIAKHRFGSRAALSLAVAGSLALAAPAWAQQVHQAEVAGAASVAAQVADGKKVYEITCMACHQADGKGLPGAFPPLAGSDYLLKDKDRAVGVVVNGLQGEVVVNDTKYNSVMPAMTQLSDKEIADALTYAMNSWGNAGGAVTTAQVAARTRQGRGDAEEGRLADAASDDHGRARSTRAHRRRQAPRASRSW